jgi:hypothetical protein
VSIHDIFSENLVNILVKNFVRKIVGKCCDIEKGVSISFQNTTEYGSGKGNKVPDLYPDPVPEHSTQYNINNDKSMIGQTLLEIVTLSLTSHYLH